MEIINHYCHGYVAVSTILNLEKKGMFSYLEENHRTFDELCTYFHANSGSLNVALNFLRSLDWLELDSNGKYCLTQKANFRHKIQLHLLELYSFSAAEFLTQAPWQQSLNLIQNIYLEKNTEAALYNDMLKGVALAPLLLSLYQLGIFKDKNLTEESQAVLGKNFDLIIDWFMREKWLKPDSLDYTPIGAYFFKRIALIAVTVSYQPMLAKLDEVLFGNFSTVFGQNSAGHEKHIDRQLNVIGSGAQHGLFFEEFKRQVMQLFSNTDFAHQPVYIADMGCGDGSLLKTLYTIILAETPRGKMLDTYPLTMIGADFNDASLQETIKTLEKNHVPYMTIKADIGDPQKFIQDLEKKGVNPDHVLHVRSFLDHDRPYIAPDLQDPVVRKQVEQRKHYSYEGVFVDQHGKKIAPEIMMQSLVEHLGRWGNVNLGYGLILSEVHYLSPEIVYKHISESENLSFDACQGFSKQYLVTMKDFLLSAAENGLFAHLASFRAFPRHVSFSRISCLRLEKKPYKIRYANLENHYPQGHWVLEIDNKIVGVISTQRINAIVDVCQTSEKTAETLYYSQGKIMQILNLFIVPEYAYLTYATVLRDFALLMAKVTPGVTEVIDVVRCEHYAKHRERYTSLKDYIQAKDQNGLPIDPALHFHVRRGAVIAGLIANYYQDNVTNEKVGILVRYPLEKINEEIE